MQNSKLIRSAIAGVVLMLAMPAVFAADYYVDQSHPSASDNNPGSEVLPWKTLYRIKQAALRAGDTVYVKPGTYDASQGSDWSMPSINPPASGAPGNPITIKALPRHSVTLRTNGAGPAIGSAGRSYIVIDGFRIPNPGKTGIVVISPSSSRIKGVVIQNNIITGVHNPHATDNTAGISMVRTSESVIRNNLITDVSNGTNTWNASAIKFFNTDHIIVENNEFARMPAGVFDKEEGEYNTFRYNYIHDTSSRGIMLYTQGGKAARGARVYQNIIVNAGTAVAVESQSSSNRNEDVAIYNNLLIGYRSGAIRPNDTAGSGTSKIYNNIFLRSGSVSRGEVYTYDDPPRQISLMNYNLYAEEPRFQVGIFTTKRFINSLAAWTSTTGHDKDGAVVSPGFVNVSAGDYKLRSDSLGIGMGRVGGVASGARINVGPYITGNETIGLLTNEDAPNPPRLIDVR